MKTREQAEARAMELFPDKTGILTEWGKLDVREYERQAFLQCWDEMQQDKQTCGFCVEPKGSQPISEQSEKKVNKSVQKELLSEMMRKDEEDGVYIKTVTQCPTCLAECTVEVEGETHYYRPKEGKLREAAEKVVYEWYNSVGEECIDAAMVELVKVLNSKKH